MNWYKSHKIAFPLSDKNLGDPGAPEYLDIGHNRFQNFETENEEGLWAMDYDLNITDFPITEKGAKGGLHSRLDMDNPQKYCAKGRYSVTPDGKTTVSLVYLFLNREDVFQWSSKRREYLGKNIVKTLDHFYDNPKIFQTVNISQELSW